MGILDSVSSVIHSRLHSAVLINSDPVTSGKNKKSFSPSSSSLSIDRFVAHPKLHDFFLPLSQRLSSFSNIRHTESEVVEFYDIDHTLILPKDEKKVGVRVQRLDGSEYIANAACVEHELMSGDQPDYLSYVSLDVCDARLFGWIPYTLNSLLNNSKEKSEVYLVTARNKIPFCLQTSFFKGAFAVYSEDHLQEWKKIARELFEFSFKKSQEVDLPSGGYKALTISTVVAQKVTDNFLVSLDSVAAQKALQKLKVRYREDSNKHAVTTMLTLIHQFPLLGKIEVFDYILKNGVTQERKVFFYEGKNGQLKNENGELLAFFRDGVLRQPDGTVFSMEGGDLQKRLGLEKDCPRSD